MPAPALPTSPAPINLQNLVFDFGTSYTLTNTGGGSLTFNTGGASTLGLGANAIINTPIATTASTVLAITGDEQALDPRRQ